MAIDLSAIKAAADALRQQSNEAPKSEPKRNQTSGAKKSAPKSKASAKTSKTSAKGGAKATNHTDTPKTQGNAKYVIPAEFKAQIEAYLYTRPDIDMSKKGKSIDGCCEYIFGVMLKRAQKERGGKTAVGMYAPPEEIYQMAVHYYDESDEDLKNEKED